MRCRPGPADPCRGEGQGGLLSKRLATSGLDVKRSLQVVAAEVSTGRIAAYIGRLGKALTACHQQIDIV
jgi:hypothetical protein